MSNENKTDAFSGASSFSDDIASGARPWNKGDLILDLYEVQDAYTGGGMGLVYKVFHRNWRTHLAVKSPRAEFFSTAGQKESFFRECETWINLGLHPNIVSCYYVREIDNIPRVFCEFIEGGSLKDWIENRRLYEGGKDSALERMLDIAIQFAWGLHYAHEQGLVHQDVKPANVMMRMDGTPLVSDFGLANAKGIVDASVQMKPGQSMMVTSGGYTPAYCSPEQVSQKSLSRRTDIWSWAVSVLEMFTGDLYWKEGPLAIAVLEDLLDNGAAFAEIPEMPNTLGSLLKSCFQHQEMERPKNFITISDTLERIYLESIGIQYPRAYPKAAETDASSLNNKAVSFLDLGKEKEAENCFREAIAKHPGHLDASYNYGLWQWENGIIDDWDLVNHLETCGESLSEPGKHDLLKAEIHLARLDIPAANKCLEQVNLKGRDGNEYTDLLLKATSFDSCDSAVLKLFESPSEDLALLCFSPNEQNVMAVEEYCSEMKLYDAATGKEIETFDDHDGDINAFCFSADGLLALSGSNDKTIKLWDVLFPTCLRTFEGHDDEVHAVCFSPDGKYVLSGSDDKTMKLWRVSTGECIRTFKDIQDQTRGYNGEIKAVGFSPDGSKAFSVGKKEAVNIWDISTGKKFFTVECDNSDNISVCFSQNGKLLLTASEMEDVELWDMTTGKRKRAIVEYEKDHWFYSASLSPDGLMVLSGSEDHYVKLWDTINGNCIRVFNGHRDDVNSVQFSPDGKLALSGSDDKTAKLWDIATGKCLRTFEGFAEEVKRVAFSPLGNYALIGIDAYNDDVYWKIRRLGLFSQNRYQSAYSISTIQNVADVLQIQNKAELLIAQARVAYSKGDNKLAFSKLSEIQALPSCERMKQVIELKKELSAHTPKLGIKGAWESVIFDLNIDDINSVCFSPDGRMALSGCDDYTIKLWDITTGKCIRTFEGHTGFVYSVCFSPDGSLAISGDYKKSIMLWEITTGKCLRTINAHDLAVKSVCFSSDGKLALSGSWDCTIKLWDISSGKCLETFAEHFNGVYSVAFLPNGNHILSASSDRSVKIWSLATGKCIRTYYNKFLPFCIHPDGSSYVTGGDGNRLRLWDLKSGACIRTFEGHTEHVWAVCISKDGRWMASGSEDKTIRIWDLATGESHYTCRGHLDTINSVCFSPDGWQLLSGSDDNTLKLWELDWELGHTEEDYRAGEQIPLSADNGLEDRQTWLDNYRQYLKEIENKAVEDSKKSYMLDYALKKFQELLLLLNQYVRLDPANQQIKHDLVQTYEKVSEIKKTQKNLQEALNADMTALELCKQYHAEDIADGFWSKLLIICHRRVGNVQLNMENYLLGRQSYLSAISHSISCHKAEPKESSWIEQMIESLERFTQLLSKSPEWKSDVTELIRVLDLALLLEFVLPGMPKSSKLVVDVLFLYGQYEEGQNRLVEAMQYYKQILAVNQSRLASDPENTEIQSQQIRAYFSRGVCLQNTNNFQSATEDYEKCLQMIESLRSTYPKDKFLLEYLYLAHLNLGLGFAINNRGIKAILHASKATKGMQHYAKAYQTLKFMEENEIELSPTAEKNKNWLESSFPKWALNSSV